MLISRGKFRLQATGERKLSFAAYQVVEELGLMLLPEVQIKKECSLAPRRFEFMEPKLS